MALKMPQARLMQPSGDVVDVVARTYDRSKQPGILLCKHSHCDVQLRHVPENKQNGRDICAYFGRRSAVGHSPNCKYAVDATLGRIVARSQRFEDMRRPIIIGPDGTATLRLNIVLEALRLAGHTPTAVGEEVQGAQGIDTAVGERTLSPYLRGVRAILALLARLGDTDEIRDVLRISYNDDVVSWRDFFYGPGDLRRLYRRLQSLNAEGRPFHPVAVVLTPFGELSETTDEVVLGCHFQGVRTPSGGEVRVAPKLVCRPPAMTKLLPLRKEHLVCSLPRVSRGALALRPSRNNTEYANIFMDVRSRNQFAVWPH